MPHPNPNPNPEQELHLVVFDEIDAICRPRGMGGDQAVGMVYDGLVNQARTAYHSLRILTTTTG